LNSKKDIQNPAGVSLWEEPVSYPTYPAAPPDPNPMFLEKRVYQGSSGGVYPNPFTDRISDERLDRSYRGVFLENEYIKVMALPEIGGRIHRGLDKSNGYDFFYHNRVIKPQLVGLYGAWISGGVEFNWPQHHRPTTFEPVDTVLEEHPDGRKTVWLGEIEPMNRMKGMHGVTLHPGKSLVEVQARLFNRTPLPQTFLWWANLAVAVNDQYQSIFPPDVTMVADHARRATSKFPLAAGFYYDIDYTAGVDISWWKNIPVPTSYMVLNSKYDFVAGYDHGRQAGVVHIANRHISPGKKMWTWGAGEFGARWYRHLTDEDGPYIELMSGVYTDNQPDFAWLQPYETKTFSQYWYPLRDIGAIKNANLDAAVNLTVEGGEAVIGLNSSARFEAAQVVLRDNQRLIFEQRFDLAPDAPYVQRVALPADADPATLTVTLLTAGGRELIGYSLYRPDTNFHADPATAAPPPEAIATTEELYLTGLHLEQYRHATRNPAPYYETALHRDPLDARNHNALGLLQLRRGNFVLAADHFRRAIERLTLKNPNPYDGEPYYNLGVALRFLGQFAVAYEAFYKAAWNYAWQAPAYFALAELDCRTGDIEKALDHVERSLATNAVNLKARNLKTALLRKSGRGAEAEALAQATVEMDRLDYGARNELALLAANDVIAQTRRADLRQLMRDNPQSHLDLALDYTGAGLFVEADEVLHRAVDGENTYPLVLYYLGYLAATQGRTESAADYFRRAAALPPDYCFPNRLETIAVLRQAIAQNPADARARYYLGNLLYDKKQSAEAIALWEQARALDGGFAIVHRNLGLAYFNIRHDAAAAKSSFETACAANPTDARLLYELDQLDKRLNADPAARLARLETHRPLVERRDDLTVELAALYNQAGRPDEALALLENRIFHPWEGGEGKVAEQYVQAHLARGRAGLQAGQFDIALAEFTASLSYPENLGEGVHEVFTKQADLFYAIGVVYEKMGQPADAAGFFEKASAERNDGSAMSYYRGLALARLGRLAEASQTFAALAAAGQAQLRKEATIDYFATSLPTFLILEDDLQKRNEIDSRLMMGLGQLGQRYVGAARREFEAVLALDINHLAAQIHRAAIEAGAVADETLLPGGVIG
jgi:tetratricopeptide (TPR) repeat protein